MLNRLIVRQTLSSYFIIKFPKSTQTMTSVGSLFVADITRLMNDIVTQFGMHDSIYWGKKDGQGLNCFFAML